MTKLVLLTLLAISVVSATVHNIDLTAPEAMNLFRTQPVKVEVDEIVNIYLRENPTTGYSWFFQTPAERN